MDVYDEIRQERQRQLDKWKIQNHLPIEWLPILMEEVGEVSREALENHFPVYKPFKGFENYRKELIQVAAVAVAMIESLDRNSSKLF